MDFREMMYISEIGKTKHMGRAAQNLFISQPALHKSLHKIEEEYDSKLFYKYKNELLPTDIGSIILSYAAKIEQNINEMNDLITDTLKLKRGHVSIGFPSIVGALYMPPILTGFLKKYEGIHLHTTESGGHTLVDKVSEGALDMAIVMRPVESPLLNEIPVVRDQVVLAVKDTDPLAEKSFVTIKDLQDVPIITFDRTFNLRNQLDKLYMTEHLTPKIFFDGNSCSFLFELFLLNDNPLVLPKPVIEHYSKDYKLIPISPVFPWELCLIFRKNTYLSTAARALIEYIQQCLLIKTESR